MTSIGCYEGQKPVGSLELAAARVRWMRSAHEIELAEVLATA
jgi:hypothetical protein